MCSGGQVAVHVEQPTNQMSKWHANLLCVAKRLFNARDESSSIAFASIADRLNVKNQTLTLPENDLCLSFETLLNYL